VQWLTEGTLTYKKSYARPRPRKIKKSKNN
jgi:hypothetical protein